MSFSPLKSNLKSFWRKVDFHGNGQHIDTLRHNLRWYRICVQSFVRLRLMVSEIPVGQNLARKKRRIINKVLKPE